MQLLVNSSQYKTSMVIFVSSVIVAEFRESKEPCVHDCMILDWIVHCSILFIPHGKPRATIHSYHSLGSTVYARYKTLLNKKNTSC